MRLAFRRSNAFLGCPRNASIVRIGLVEAMLVGTLLLIAVVASGQLASTLPPQDRLAEAQRLQTAGDFGQARDLYEQILQANSSDAVAREGMSSSTEHLALSARAAGDMDSALADLLRAQKVEPDDTRVLYDLGILEDEMHLYKDADKVLDQLVSIEPNEPNVLYARARVKLDLGQLEVAQQDMQAYLKARPMDASAHYGLGRIYLQGLQFDKAHAEFEQSITIQPQQTEAYYQLGQTDLDQNNYPDAIQLFQKTLGRDPQHGGALAGLGIAYFKLKEYDNADQWLTKAVKVAPGYQPAHYYLGLALARLNKADESTRELQTAAALADKDNAQSASGLHILSPGDHP